MTTFVEKSAPGVFSQFTPVKFPVGWTEKEKKARQSRLPASHDKDSKRHTVPLGAMLGIVPFRVLNSAVASFWAVLFPRRGLAKAFVSG